MFRETDWLAEKIVNYLSHKHGFEIPAGIRRYDFDDAAHPDFMRAYEAGKAVQKAIMDTSSAQICEYAGKLILDEDKFYTVADRAFSMAKASRRLGIAPRQTIEWDLRTAAENSERFPYRVFPGSQDHVSGQQLLEEMARESPHPIHGHATRSAVSPEKRSGSRTIFANDSLNWVERTSPNVSQAFSRS